MAFSSIAKTPLSSLKAFQRHSLAQPQTQRHRASGTSIRVLKPIKCMCVANKVESSEEVVRRSANYARSMWDNDYVMSLNNPYEGEMYTKRAEMLKEKVRDMFGEVSEPLDQIEFIDTLQRLGLAYHYEDEIRGMLERLYNSTDDGWKRDDLNATSLEFRLLRQHGFDISPDVFANFIDERGSLKASLAEDVKAMVSLYEASYHSFEGENILEEAWQFANKHLQNLKKDHKMSPEVNHALELPLHWRANRSEAGWFIRHYQKTTDFNSTLLEFAKLDFNILQELYQQELRQAIKWFNENDLTNQKLGFVRDSLVISFNWAATTAFEPEYSSWRVVNTELNNLLTSIDDIYDVYGTLEEIEMFTDTIDRWDIRGMKDLPKYMRITFLATFNLFNGLAYDILQRQDFDVTMDIKNSLLGLLKAYRQEARWFHSGYKPSMEEYMQNGVHSIAGPLMTFFQFVSSPDPIVIQEHEYLKTDPHLVKCLSSIGRLQNDLGTSSNELKRGDIPKSVQLYMMRDGVSEEVAREEVKNTIRQMWKKANTLAATNSILSKRTIKLLMGHLRAFHNIYLYGDGYSVQDQIKNLTATMLFEPIAM